MFYRLLVFCWIEHLKVSSPRRVSNYDQVIVVLRLIANKLMVTCSSVDEADAEIVLWPFLRALAASPSKPAGEYKTGPFASASKQVYRWSRIYTVDYTPPRWHSSIMIRSKKSSGYSPKYGASLPSSSLPLMNVWNIVKKTLAFLGTVPFLRISLGFIRAGSLLCLQCKIYSVI
jgi:hypothetical protein